MWAQLLLPVCVELSRRSGRWGNKYKPNTLHSGIESNKVRCFPVFEGFSSRSTFLPSAGTVEISLTMSARGSTARDGQKSREREREMLMGSSVGYNKVPGLRENGTYQGGDHAALSQTSTKSGGAYRLADLVRSPLGLFLVRVAAGNTAFLSTHMNAGTHFTET